MTDEAKPDIQLEPIKEEVNENSVFSAILPDSSGALSPLEEYKSATDKKIADIETLTKAILFVAIVGLIGIVVAVVGLFLDQVHYNNQNYNQRSNDFNSRLVQLESKKE